MRKKRVGFTIFLGLSLTLAFIKLSVADDISYYNLLMKQHVHFKLIGQVVDGDNNPLEDVKLKITKYHFNPESTKLAESEEESLVNETFDLNFQDLVAIKIIASKEGYLNSTFEANSNNLLLNRMTEIQSEVENGNIQRPQNFEEIYNLLSGLQYEDASIRLTLVKSKGRIIEFSKQRFSFEVDDEKKVHKIEIRDALGTVTKPAVFLEFVFDESGDVQSKLFLGTINAGINVIKPALNIHDMKEAPDEGYIEKTEISNYVPKEEFSFFIKTSNGKYGKGVANLRYFDIKRKEAKLVVTHFAFQDDNTRYVETDPEVE